MGWPPASGRPVVPPRPGKAPLRNGRAVPSTRETSSGQESRGPVRDPAHQGVKLQERIKNLWERAEVPDWHRELYTARYFDQGVHPEVLQREAASLAEGKALVQVARQAIASREAVLAELLRLRRRHADADFGRSRGPACSMLRELLTELRGATVDTVEALNAWRWSVAPLPGRRHSEGCCSVAGPGARGACWHFPEAPCGDYLWRVLNEDDTVHLFESVLKLSPERDPLLLKTAGAPDSDKLRPPPPKEAQITRLRGAEMLLCEEETALKVFAGARQRAGMGAVSRGSSKSPGLAFEAVCSRLQSLELPSLRPDSKQDMLLCTRDTPTTRASSSASPMLLSRPASEPADRPPSSRSNRPHSAGSPSGGEQKHALPARPHSVAAGYASNTQQSGAKRPAPSLPIARRDAPLQRQEAVTEDNARTLPQAKAAQRVAGRNVARTLSGKSRVGPAVRRSPKLRDVMHGMETPLVSAMSNVKGGRSKTQLFKQRSKSTVGDDDSDESDDDDDDDPGAQSPGGSRIVERVRRGAVKQNFKILNEDENPERINAVFKRLANDGVIHRHDMIEALRRLGFLYANKDWVDEAFRRKTTWTTVDRDEFEAVIKEYKELQMRFWNQEFLATDADHSGKLDVEEFASLLRRMKIEPMRHVLYEAIDAVDTNNDGTLDFGEFCEIMRLLRNCEGFTQNEWNKFKQVFQNFDNDGSGDMESGELFRALLYLGYHITHERAEEISREVDFDRSGSIDLHEFGCCLRTVRDCEVEKLKRSMDRFPSQPLSKEFRIIPLDQLAALLHDVGYYPEWDVVEETWEEVCMQDGCDPRVYAFDLSRLWQFLTLFREKEGLSASEVADVDAAFAKYAQPPDDTHADQHHRMGKLEGEVRANNISKVIRSMGYSIPFEEQQLILTRVDIEEQGRFDVMELRKMVRMIREQRNRAIRDAFIEYCNLSGIDASVSGMTISETVCKEALRSLGCVQDARTQLEVQTMENVYKKDAKLHQKGIDLQKFISMARFHDEHGRRAFRENDGYTEEELKKMKESFALFDADGNGDVDHKELIQLVKMTFPGIASDPKMRNKLMAIMSEADQDGSGSLDFPDFLRLMRAVSDFSQRRLLKKEQRAIKQTGFNSHEVYEFRELFLSHAGPDGFLSQHEFHELIAPVLPLGSRNLTALSILWAQPTGAENGDDSSDSDGLRDVDTEYHEEMMEKDFPDFLWLMRTILATNFGGVLERSRVAAKPVGDGGSRDSVVQQQ